MNRYILILCLCLAATIAFAQHALHGTVIDVDTGDPVPEAEIHDDLSGRVKVADAQGRFIFRELVPGLHTLTVFRTGYNTRTDTVFIGRDIALTIELEQLSIELSAVEITAKKEELFALRQMRDVEGTAIYAGRKTEVVQLDLITGNLAANNARQVFAQVAGLNIYEGSDGGLQLGIGGRGLDPNRTSNFNTRQNGYDISADVLGYPESYYTPPSEAISEIQIIRGASSLQYGTQFGGLVNFKTRKIPSYKKVEVLTRQTIGSFGFFNSFNSVGVNAGKFSFNTHFNYKTGDGFRANSAFDSKSLFLSAAWSFSDQTTLSGEVTSFDYLARQAGGLTDRQFERTPRLSTRDRNWFEVDWLLYNLRLEHSFGNGADLSVSLFGLDAARNSVGFRGNPVNLNANPITAIDEQGDQGNYLQPRDLVKGAFRNAGAEVRYLDVYALSGKKAVYLIGAKYYHARNTSFQGPGSFAADADFSSYAAHVPDYPNRSEYTFPNVNTAIFGEHILYLTDRLSVTPGFRFEYIKTGATGSYNKVVFDNAGNVIDNNMLFENRQLERSFALFGLGMSYRKSQAVQLYANLSQNYRSVTFSDIRVVSPTFIVDPDISDEKGLTADIGIRGRMGRTFSYDAGIYSVLYDDRIGVILDDRANRVRTNIGRALIAGFESLADLNIARMVEMRSDLKLNVFVNTALTWSEYLASEQNNVTGNSVEFVPNVNLKTGLQAGFRDLLASVQLTVLSKQYTDAQNSPVAQAGDMRSGIVGEIPGYQVLDCSLSMTLGSFSIEGGANNLLDQAYFTRRATGYPGPGIIPSDGRSFYITLGYNY